MVRPASLVLLLLLAFPSWVGALGLGDIELRSKLSQELEARIPLISVQPAELEAINVDLADFETFRRAGVDRPSILNSRRFRVVDGGDGAFISVTTKDPVNEPFLNFLVELDWPSGRLIREFTLLLDPPIYGAALSAVGQQVVTQPKVQGQLQGSSSASDSASQRARVGPGQTYGPVGRTDTLWSIASQVRPQGVTTQQTMLAILKANPSAFVNSNVNALRAGSILNIPSADAVRQLTASEAVAEVGRQNTDWGQLRRQLAATTPKPAAPAPPTPGASDSSTASTSTPSPGTGALAPPLSATETPAPPSQPEGQVRISGGSSQVATTGTATSGEVQALENRLDSALEELGQLQGQVDALNDNLGKADALVEEMNRAVQVRDNQLAALQSQLAAAQSALRDVQTQVSATEPSPEQPSEPKQTTAAATQSEGQSKVGQQAKPKAEASQTVETKPEPRAPPPPPPPPPRTAAKEWYEQIPELASRLPVDPIVLGGAIGAIIVIIILALLVKARHGKSANKKPEPASPGLEEVMQNPEVYDAKTEVPDEETTQVDSLEIQADLDGSGTVVQGEVFNPDATMRSDQIADEDPLEEVNVYLAYEQFGQAEDAVRKAIDTHPERAEYKLKLMEVQHGARDRNGFMQTMRALEAVVGADDALMDEARALLGSLPDSAPASAGDTGIDLADGLPLSVADTVDAGLDFDLGFDTDDAGAATVDPRGSVDFDLGLDFSEKSDKAASDTELDFTLDAEDEASAEGSDSILDFTLDGDDEIPSDLESDGSVDFDFDLELGTDGLVSDEELSGKEVVTADAAVPEPPQTPEPPEPYDASGLDTEVLDFDLAFGEDDPSGSIGSGDPGDPGATSMATDDAADMTLGGDSEIDVDLDATDGVEEVASLDAGSTESGGEDFGLDLDLDLGGLEEEPAAANTDVDPDPDFATVQLEVPGGNDDVAEDDAERSVSLLGMTDDADDSSAPEFDIEFDLADSDIGETVDLVSSAGEDEVDGNVHTELMLDVPGSDSASSDELGDLLGNEDSPGPFDLDIDEETLSASESAETVDNALGEDASLGGFDVDADALESSVLDTSSFEDGGLDFDLTFDDEPQVDDMAATTGEFEFPDEELGSDEITDDASEAIALVAAAAPGLDDFDTDVPDIDDLLELPLPPDEQPQPSVSSSAEDSEAGFDLNLDDFDPLGSGTATMTGDSLAFGETVTVAAAPGFEPELGDDEGSAPVLDIEDEELVDLSGLTMESEGSSGSVDFLLDFDEEPETQEPSRAPTQGLGTIDNDEPDETEYPTLRLDGSLESDLDEVQTKLDLAQEYLAMGDKEAAGEVLDEVLSEGNDAQKQAARTLRAQVDT